MDAFGIEFVSYIATYGYDRVLRILYANRRSDETKMSRIFFSSGHNMRDFLNGLDNLHEYMRYTYPRMRPPSFYVEKETAQGLTLHYRSRRRGFVHYVIGQITEVRLSFSSSVRYVENSVRRSADDSTIPTSKSRSSANERSWT